MQLRTKFALVLLLVAVVLSGATFGALEFYKGQAVAQIEGNVQQRATLTAEQVERTLRDRRDYVGLYASRPAVADFSRSDERLSVFLNNSDFHAAMIVAANGTVVDTAGLSASTRQRLQGRDISDRRYVQAALGLDDGDARAHIADPAYDAQYDQWVVSISAPITEAPSSTGRPAGALVASTGLSPRGSGGQFDSAGFFDAIAPLETDSSSVAVTAIVDGERRYLHEPARTFERNVTGRALIEETGWRVVVRRDRSTLRQRLENLALLQGASIFVVLVTVIGLGVWEYRTNLSNAERLLDGFERLQDGDYEFALSLSAAEEWRKISDGYNELSTGIREREQAIREREQRLEVLNRVLRHNLKNDMSVILTYAGFVADSADSEAVADAGETISEKGQKLVAHGEKARMIEEAMSDDTEPNPVDLVDVVATALADVESEYPSVTVERDLPDTARVRALPTLEYAVRNVCENAAEHNTNDEPHVAVTVEESGDRVELVVADNGPGIPDHEVAVLDSGEETALEHGSGVGLWLVYWVVDNSGGDLVFEDRDPEGSVVRMTLDAAAPAGDETTPGSEDVARATPTEPNEDD